MSQKDLTLNIGANTQQLNAALGRMRKDVRAATGNVTAIMNQAGMQMTAALTVPLAAFGRSAIQNFQTFEQSMAKVKAVSGATAGEFEDLEANAKQLGASTRFTASEVASLQLEYSKLGFSSDELLKVTDATLALAQATDSDLSQAAAVAGSTLRGFGLDAAETGRVVDVMANSFSSTALDINAFQDSMKYLAPVAKAAGVSLEQSTAMLGALANAGIKGSQAGTALRRIFVEMADTGLPAADAIRKLADEGIELADAKDEVGRNAMSALLVLTKMQPQIAELTTQFENSKGTAKEMAGVMDDTLEGSFKRMSSAMEAVSISFGETFEPVARGLADVMAGLASGFAKLPGPLKAILGVLGILTAAAGPLILLSPQLLAARQAMLAFRNSAIAAKAATLALNPAFLLITGSIVAITSLITIYNAKMNKAKAVNDNLRKSMDKVTKAHKKMSSEMRGKAAAQSTEELNKRLAELDAQLKAVNPGMEEATQGADIYARLNTEGAEAINAHKKAQVAASGATVAKRKAEYELLRIENERNIILAELQSRTDDAADSNEDATEKVDQLTAAQQRLNDAMKAGEKLGLDPDQLNVGGLLSKLGEGADDGTSTIFAAQFTLSDEDIAYADEQTDKATQNAKAKLDDFKNSVSSLGQSLTGTFSSIFSQLASGTKSFGQIMGDILQQLLIKVAAMVAAFAVLSVITGGAAGTLGNFMKQGFGMNIPQMASGGIVSGPQLLVAGEYPGARSNPEVIAPLSKLQGMMGGGNLSARISGRDILLTTSRDRNQARRQFTSTLI